MQLSLLGKNELRYVKSWSHGGVALKNRRKTKRPLVPNKVTHVVFKSSKAKGSLSFYTHKLKVQNRLKERSKKYLVNILDCVNMGNHIHLKVKFKNADNFKNFLRTFAALLARDITGANKNKAFGKFWDGLVFTRVLHSTLEELGLKGYFEANRKQRTFSYAERERFLGEFNKFIMKLKGRKGTHQI